MIKKYKVNATKCHHTSTQDEVYGALKDITNNLTKAWDKIENAKTVLVKFNAVYWLDRLQLYKGKYQQEIIDMRTMRAVLRLLTERSDAQIMVMDTSITEDPDDDSDIFFREILAEYPRVVFVNANLEPGIWVDVPGGGAIFNRYLLHPKVKTVDAVVSVSKMKSHGSAGITMCTKNLFGLSPIPPAGRTRGYYHHSIRLPYVMADLGKIFDPCLNIVDAMVCQSGREWHGDAVETNCLIAGDNVTATDACGMQLMGHDPLADWPNAPFLKEHNHIKIAAENGSGTNKLEEIDFSMDIASPIGKFESRPGFNSERFISWQKTCAEQALFYRDNAEYFLKKYENEYIFLQMNKVVWHGDIQKRMQSRSKMSGDHPEQTMWLKYMDPENHEQEHYEVYENILEIINSL